MMSQIVKQQLPESPIEFDGDSSYQEDGLDEEDNEGMSESQAEVEVELPVEVEQAIRVIYDQRDILDLGSNIMSEQLVQYTVLPLNNDNCFFQNQSQYWRLRGVERQECLLEKCSCCDFIHPSTHSNLEHGLIDLNEMHWDCRSLCSAKPLKNIKLRLRNPGINNENETSPMIFLELKRKHVDSETRQDSQANNLL